MTMSHHISVSLSTCRLASRIQTYAWTPCHLPQKTLAPYLRVAHSQSSWHCANPLLTWPYSCLSNGSSHQRLRALIASPVCFQGGPVACPLWELGRWSAARWTHMAGLGCLGVRRKFSKWMSLLLYCCRIWDCHQGRPSYCRKWVWRPKTRC